MHVILPAFRHFRKGTLMAYGCVFVCTWAPIGSPYYAGDIVVFPCNTPCQDFTMPDGTEMAAVSDECMDWPPDDGQSLSFETIDAPDKGVIHRAKGIQK